MTVATQPLSETSFHGVVSNPRCYMRKNTMYVCGLYTMFISLSDMCLLQHGCPPLPLGRESFLNQVAPPCEEHSSPFHTPAQQIFLEGNSSSKTKLGCLAFIEVYYPRIQQNQPICQIEVHCIYFFTFCSFNMCVQCLSRPVPSSPPPPLQVQLSHPVGQERPERHQHGCDWRQGEGPPQIFPELQTEVLLINIILPTEM